MHTFYMAVNERLDKGEQVCLVMIVQQKGSTPRDVGTMMAVYADGTITGTIGGGLAEAQVIQAGHDLLKQDQARRIMLQIAMTDSKSASSMGMVCGGEVTILLTLLRPEDQGLIATLLHHIDTEQICFLAVSLDKEPVTDAPFLLVDDSQAPEAMDYSHIRSLAGRPPRPVTGRVQGRSWLFCPITGAPKVYFFGAGHVSRSTVEIAALSDFSPIVVDDRPDLATTAFFPRASQVYCLPSFDGCVAQYNLTSDDLVVIASRVPLLDNLLLEQVLATPAGFVGMLGSVRKREAIFADLRAKGVSQADIDRVHCPLGLSIGARTPQEIGVSIVAQLIQARRTGL